MSCVTYPNTWKGCIDIVGISNLYSFLNNTSPWRRSLREPEYGYLFQKDLLEKLSPINYIDHLKSPVFIIQGFFFMFDYLYR
jgi:dipeptidyl aminopeptidase/acylaminoacyl peptidase